jgi:hypothetical protein
MTAQILTSLHGNALGLDGKGNLCLKDQVVARVINNITPATIKLADLPVGAYEISSHINVTLTRSATGINADYDGDISIGTDAANN